MRPKDTSVRQPNLPPVERSCALCGAVFTIKAALVREGRGRFCSLTCRRRHHAPEQRDCLVCRRPFLATFQQIKNGQGACCSFRCRNNSRARRPAEDAFTSDWACAEGGAWFIGLWMADGYLSPAGHLTLSLVDRDAIDMAASVLGLGRDAITLHSRLNQWRLRVTLVRNLPLLNALGILPGKKTGREFAPALLADNRHFWRGVVDGDGWISGSRGTVGLVTASPELSWQFMAFVARQLGQWPSLVVRRNNTRTETPIPLYQLSVTGKTAVALGHLLYGESSFAMERKAIQYRTLVERGERIVAGQASARAKKERVIAAYLGGARKRTIATAERIAWSRVCTILHEAGIE